MVKYPIQDLKLDIFSRVSMMWEVCCVPRGENKRLATVHRDLTARPASVNWDSLIIKMEGKKRKDSDQCGLREL